MGEHRRSVAAVAVIALGLASGCRGPGAAARGAGHPLASVLVHADEGTAKAEVWGEWRRLLRGETAAAKDVSLALFTLAPGQAPHPPHQHADEELMILVAGSGTWHLAGKESPAREGDVVYAAPWDFHGLRNTGDLPLRYYVLKWTVSAPAGR